MQTATFQDFDFNTIKNSLLKKGKYIGSKPDYFSLENFNLIRFDENCKAHRAHNIHIALYVRNKVTNEPPLMVISYNS